MYGNSIVLVIWQWIIKYGSVVCANVLVFVWFWNEDNCDRFPNIEICISVEGNILHVCEVVAIIQVDRNVARGNSKIFTNCTSKNFNYTKTKSLFEFNCKHKSKNNGTAKIQYSLTN